MVATVLLPMMVAMTVLLMMVVLVVMLEQLKTVLVMATVLQSHGLAMDGVMVLISHLDMI
tara:strand:+ start:41 stop:220 length:180 start_codon:yes stop_codon:yes gene_type:complete